MNLKEIESIKAEGNDFFRAKDQRNATISFRKGVDMINAHQLELESNPEVKTLFVQLSTNLALCLLNDNQLTETIAVCNNVLKVEADNTKALYRRALANKSRAETHNVATASAADNLKEKDALYSLARADLERLNNLDQTNKAVKQELSNVVKEAVKVKIALKAADPEGFAKAAKQSSKLVSQKEQINNTNDAEQDESEEQNVPINRKKLLDDLRKHDDYKVAPNFTLEQLNQVSKNAFETVSEQILARETTPASHFQFEQEFDALKKHPQKLYLYFNKLPATSFAALYAKKDFPPQYLLLLLEAVALHAENTHYETLVNAFSGIKDTYKFNLCLMQITKEEKKRILSLFERIGASEVLKKAYKLI